MSIMETLSEWIRSLTGAVLAAATLGLTTTDEASAQKWPEKTVRIVTPFAPGGGTDIFARILAQRLTEVLRPAVHRRESPRRGIDDRHRVRRARRRPTATRC